jgi:hypothetical protein
VDPVTDPLLLRKSGSTGNPTRDPGSVARNSKHLTTEAMQGQIMKPNVPVALDRHREESSGTGGSHSGAAAVRGGARQRAAICIRVVSPRTLG